MSQDFASILNAGSTDDVMDVDTSFLDAYRSGGPEALKAEQERADHDAEPEDGLADERGQEAPGEHGGSGSGSTGEASQAAGRDPEPEPEAVAEEIEADASDDVEDELDEFDGPEHDDPLPSHDDDELIPSSLRLTDHQDAVQAAASSSARSGGSGADGDGADLLPRSGFRVDDVSRQPNIKSLPDSIMDVLREQLRSAAVRELGVADAVAREFSDRLGQGTLVTAFLIAQLDLRLGTDAATARAAELFRSRDPLLGSVVARMKTLEAREREQAGLLKALAGQLSEVKETGAVVEQALAYSIADRTENFLRGSHTTSEAPIGHKTAVLVRDRAREATKKQSRIERERDGRPIR